MEKDEERREAEAEDERDSHKAPSESPASSGRSVESAGQGRPEGSGRNMRTVVISLASLVLGAALFAVGFLAHSLLDDDVDLNPVEEDLATLTEQVGTIQSVLGIAGDDVASPTPAPVVEATADDDPFMGPEDASVTIIEFTDYQ